jgi:hypothetical protein
MEAGLGLGSGWGCECDDARAYLQDGHASSGTGKGSNGRHI